MEDFTISFKDGLDLHKLQNTAGEGVEFEVEGCAVNREREEHLTNADFDGENVFQNRCTGDLLGEDGDDDSESTPFERLEKKMVDISPDKDRGVLKKVLTPGAGPAIPSSALVIIDYNAYLEYADEPYDSSYLRRSKCHFRLGEGQVVLGLDIAASTMKKGEKSRFLIKPAYGLGQFGSPPRVPANATLMFEVELVDFVKKEAVQNYFDMTDEERRSLSFEEVLKICKDEKEEAVRFFNGNQHTKAFHKYQYIVDILEQHPLETEQEEEIQRTHLLKLYLNLALCSLKLTHSKRALTYCSKALNIDPNNVKAFYRRGQAFHQLRKFDDARQSLIRARNLDSKNRNIRRELELLNLSIKESKLVDKLAEADYCRKMFKTTTSDSNSSPINPPSYTPGSISPQVHTNPLEECSAEFRQHIRQWLQNFKDNDSLELKPPGALTTPEIACLMEEAEKLGLDPVLRNFGSRSELVIKKK